MSTSKSFIVKVMDFMVDRFPLHHLSFEHMVTKKEVPIHKMSWAYYMGGLTLLFFLIQLVTGVFLLFIISRPSAMPMRPSNILPGSSKADS